MANATNDDQLLIAADLKAADEHLELARHHRFMASEALRRARIRKGEIVTDDTDLFDFDGQND